MLALLVLVQLLKVNPYVIHVLLEHLHQSLVSNSVQAVQLESMPLLLVKVNALIARLVAMLSLNERLIVPIVSEEHLPTKRVKQSVHPVQLERMETY